MIRIIQYLQEVYEDLQKYIDNDVCLCKFKKLNFEERVKEIGRMLVGEKVTEDVLEIANSMLNEG